MEHLRLINLYSQGTDDFDTSPFEALEMLQIRSELHKATLTKEEQKMVEHISEIYDFSTSKELLDEW